MWRSLKHLKNVNILRCFGGCQIWPQNLPHYVWPHGVKFYFLLASSIVQVFEVLTFDKILGSVKLHIGDSWGKMKTLALLYYWSSNWEFYSRMCYWEARVIFLWCFIMADANFPFPLTHRKQETQTLGGLVIRSFALGDILGELGPFFRFFIMVDANFPFLLTLGKPET